MLKPVIKPTPSRNETNRPHAGIPTGDRRNPLGSVRGKDSPREPRGSVVGVLPGRVIRGIDHFIDLGNLTLEGGHHTFLQGDVGLATALTAAAEAHVDPGVLHRRQADPAAVLPSAPLAICSRFVTENRAIRRFASWELYLRVDRHCLVF